MTPSRETNLSQSIPSKLRLDRKKCYETKEIKRGKRKSSESYALHPILLSKLSWPYRYTLYSSSLLAVEVWCVLLLDRFLLFSIRHLVVNSSFVCRLQMWWGCGLDEGQVAAVHATWSTAPLSKVVVLVLKQDGYGISSSQATQCPAVS